MKKLAAAVIISIASLGFSNAFALSIDNNTATNSHGSAKFEDPDNAIPFPHMSDDGQPANFQAQPVGNTGTSFSLTPTNAEPDAFQRAQERMQQ